MSVNILINYIKYRYSYSTNTVMCYYKPWHSDKNLIMEILWQRSTEIDVYMDGFRIRIQKTEPCEIVFLQKTEECLFQNFQVKKSCSRFQYKNKDKECMISKNLSENNFYWEFPKVYIVRNHIHYSTGNDSKRDVRSY